VFTAWFNNLIIQKYIASESMILKSNYVHIKIALTEIWDQLLSEYYFRYQSSNQWSLEGTNQLKCFFCYQHTFSFLLVNLPVRQARRGQRHTKKKNSEELRISTRQPHCCSCTPTLGTKFISCTVHVQANPPYIANPTPSGHNLSVSYF
jgi:hypothetical protein